MDRVHDGRQLDGRVSAWFHLRGIDDAILMRLGRFRFKRAESGAELEQVHRLNDETFVREVAQYDDTGSDRLVDKFHDKNIYLIAMQRRRAGGHGRRARSAAVLGGGPAGRPDRCSTGWRGRPMEVRLLAVRPGHRRGPVFSGLLWALREYARRHGHACLLISGLEERVPLYAKLGFRALGPAVACGRAAFVPMTLDFDRPTESLQRSIALWSAHFGRGMPADSPIRSPSCPVRPGSPRGCGRPGASPRSRTDPTRSSRGTSVSATGSRAWSKARRPWRCSSAAGRWPTTSWRPRSRPTADPARG